MNTEERARLLIVDDVLGNIEILAAALSERYDISFASSGAEGIDIASRYPPELILLDIMMPGMNGFEACRHLRAHATLHDVPIIFISALDEVADKVNAFHAGGNDYVTKPFQAEEVLARVSTHITLYRTRRELRDREESLHHHLAELENANRRLLKMGHKLVLAEKQAAIGQLAAGIAHEINNPISFINSNLSTLKGYVTDLLELVDAYGAAESQLPATLRADLAARRESIDLPYLQGDIHPLIDESRTGAERVRIIVQNLQDFSRSLDEPVEAVDLHKLLDEALSNIWKTLVSPVKIVKEYGPLPHIEGLPMQIAQALENLLRNAVQSMPEGGCLTLRTEWIVDWVRITISDTGHGITPEIQSRIFDPFFTTQPVGKGTGLGLSVAYGIITRHGGHIDVTSQPGYGSNFTIRLPLHYGQTDEQIPGQ